MSTRSASRPLLPALASLDHVFGWRMPRGLGECDAVQGGVQLVVPGAAQAVPGLVRRPHRQRCAAVPRSRTSRRSSGWPWPGPSPGGGGHHLSGNNVPDVGQDKDLRGGVQLQEGSRAGADISHVWRNPFPHPSIPRRTHVPINRPSAERAGSYSPHSFDLRMVRWYGVSAGWSDSGGAGLEARPVLPATSTLTSGPWQRFVSRWQCVQRLARCCKSCAVVSATSPELCVGVGTV